MGRKKVYTDEELKERNKERMKEYRANPEIKERIKEYKAKPEVKERMKEYGKEYGKEYRAKPEVKERLSEYRMQYRNDPETKQRLSEKKRQYRNRIEVRQKEKEYSKEYYAKPEVKERMKEYGEEYRAKPEVKERTAKRDKERNKKKRQEYIESEKYLIYIKAKEESLISKKCSICNVVKLKSFFTTSGASKQTGSIWYKPYCKQCSKFFWEIKSKDSDYLNKLHKRQNDWRKRVYDKSKEKRKMDARIDRFGGIDEWRKAANLKHRERRLLKRDALVLSNAGSSCPLIEANCVGCKELFLVRENGRTKTNKEWCLICINNGKYKNTYKIKPVKVNCIDCNKEYFAGKQSKRCIQCNKIHNKIRFKRSSSIRGRVKKYGVIRIPYKSIDVFKRDKWICYICNKKTIIYPKDGYHENGATIDHIIPLSLGGSDELSNIKTCCHKCNSAKSASVTTNTQLSLFTIIKNVSTH
jgi:5-methylcytosine-specific restriction endonuclease McrA